MSACHLAGYPAGTGCILPQTLFLLCIAIIEVLLLSRLYILAYSCADCPFTQCGLHFVIHVQSSMRSYAAVLWTFVRRALRALIFKGRYAGSQTTGRSQWCKTSIDCAVVLQATAVPPL